MILVGLVPVVTGIIIDVATELRNNAFIWAIVAVVTITAAGLTYRMRVGSFSPAPSWLPATVGAAMALVLIGTFTYERLRPPPPSCTGVTAAQVSMQKDPRTDGRIWPMAYRCPKPSSARVFERPSFEATVVGTMDPGSSWVICWTSGNGREIWYYTQGDHWLARHDYHAWGFIPSGVLVVTHHPDSAVSRCPKETARSLPGSPAG